MHGEYDWPQITWLNALLGAGSRVIFAGAHIGAVLIPIVRHAAIRAVVAYEPSPRNFRLLTMNLQLNGIDGVVTFNTALGERCGSIQFTENSINTGNSRVAPSTRRNHRGSGNARSHHCRGLGTDRSNRHGHRGQRGRSHARGAVDARQDPKSLCGILSGPAWRARQRRGEVCASNCRSISSLRTCLAIQSFFWVRGKFAEHLKALQDCRSLLLNVLFTQDIEANPQRSQAPCALPKS